MPLQPIVENALKNGLAPKGGTGRLLISAAPQGSFILLTVCDDGMGFERRHVGPLNIHPSPTGVGLTNTIARLQTMYGNRASLEIKSSPAEGCRISIIYPSQVPLYALPHH